MSDSTNENPRLTPETEQMLYQLPLAKAFLGDHLNTETWVENVASKLENIRSRFKGDDEKILYAAMIKGLTSFALNSRFVNPSLPDKLIRRAQEILIALGFEAFLQKVDIEKYGPISTLIRSKLRDIGLIDENILMEKEKEIFDWYNTSWKVGYILASIIGKSPSEDRKIDQPPQPDKPTDSGDLGPFEDFINKSLSDL